MNLELKSAHHGDPNTGRRLGAPPPVRPNAHHRLRLQTLVRLRWLAVAGQLTTVIIVYFGLGFPLPLGPCLAAIAVSAWLNIYLTIRYRANLRLRNRYAVLLLAYDILQLAVLLYLTGGLQNPFSFLFLVPAHRFGFDPADSRHVGPCGP